MRIAAPTIKKPVKPANATMPPPPLIDTLIVGAYNDGSLTHFAKSLDRKFSLSLEDRVRESSGLQRV